MHLSPFVTRWTTVFLLSLLPAITWSQVSINGHMAPFDRQSKTWLAIIPESLFGQDALFMVNIDNTCKQMVIGSDTISAEKESLHLFKQISPDSTYTATITDLQGLTATGHIQFTFLPVVRLQGTFGHDYQEATLTMAIPELTEDSLYAARIKWRGGTTNSSTKHKHNYKLKFDHDVQFFGLRSDNNWMLDAGQPDVFRMRNRIAMDLWNDMARQPYYSDKKPKARNGVSGKMVEVFLNDEYLGIYNFSELMDRKQLKLKKIDAETSEIHGCLYKGTNWNHTQMFDLFESYDNTKDVLLGFEMKYPEFDDSDTVDWSPLVEANNFAIESNDAAFESSVADYFDLPVLVDYSLFLSIVNGVDNSGKNMYWAVYDKAEERRLTPTPWDLDATFGQRWGNLLTQGDESMASPGYMTDVDVMVFFRLYKNNVMHFNDLLNERYQELHQSGGVLSTDSLISRFTYYYQAMKKSGAAQRETLKWSGDSDVWGDVIDFDAEYDYICQWITEHINIIDQTTFPLYYTKEFFDDIISGNIHSVRNLNSRAVYDLKGRKVSSDSYLKPGIYIRNGKKIVISRR